jgi:hypothetical protein
MSATMVVAVAPSGSWSAPAIASTPAAVAPAVSTVAMVADTGAPRRRRLTAHCSRDAPRDDAAINMWRT